jgi:integrase/recombinase XerC
MDYLPANSINKVLDIQNLSDISVFQKLLAQDLSANTKKALVSDLRHFVLWYEQINKDPFTFSRLTVRDISDYKTYSQTDLCLSVNTINRRLMSIRALCKVAVEEGRIKENPVNKVKLLTLQPLAPKGLQEKDSRALLKEVELRGNLRDQLAVEMMYGAGFRVSELVNLKVSDVFITERKGHALVRNGKGGKTRQVPLNARIRTLLSEYIAKYSPADNLFLGQRGALTAIAFNKIIDVYAKKAGVKCTPHSLRHTFAYNYLKHFSGEIVGLAQILGHNSVSTTAIYTQNRLEDLQEKVENML